MDEKKGKKKISMQSMKNVVHELESDNKDLRNEYWEKAKKYKEQQLAVCITQQLSEKNNTGYEERAFEANEVKGNIMYPDIDIYDKDLNLGSEDGSHDETQSIPNNIKTLGRSPLIPTIRSQRRSKATDCFKNNNTNDSNDCQMNECYDHMGPVHDEEVSLSIPLDDK